MSSPNPETLGQQLQRLVSLKRPVVNENNPQDCARAERHAVSQFFVDARVRIEQAIASGKLPAPLPLGSTPRSSVHSMAGAALEQYRWNSTVKEVPKDSEYHDLWVQFSAWARSEQLEVWFEGMHDGVGVHSWHVLQVRPEAKLGPPPALVEGSVVLPKELVDQHGSVAAYIRHLEQLAGCAKEGS